MDNLSPEVKCFYIEAYYAAISKIDVAPMWHVVRSRQGQSSSVIERAAKQWFYKHHGRAKPRSYNIVIPRSY